MTATADPVALQQARQVADAVLYEGYLLYPYRASSAKNQVRWQFGVLGPAGAVGQMVGEDPVIFVEFLLEPLGAEPKLDLHLRFLQTQWRSPQRLVDAAAGQFAPVDELRVGAETWIAWHEAVEHEITIPDLTVEDLVRGHETRLEIASSETSELVHDDTGRVGGRLVRTRFPLTGRLVVRGTRVATTPSAVVVRVEVENTARLDETEETSRAVRRDLAARQSFVSTHLLMTTRQASFVSMVDPPEWAADVAAQCSNARCWPVLAGEHGEDEQRSDVMLAAPIILGDYPQIAEQSPGQLFDSAEIDEILTLRIMTMTDEEKAAARATDPHAAAIVERSDQMPPDVFERLHGVLRSAAAETDVLMVGGIAVSKGSRVILRPSRRADAQDMFLAGQIAVVRRIDHDVDGGTHVAVLLEDDPAHELHDWHGRYFYFGVEEIEPLSGADVRGVSS